MNLHCYSFRRCSSYSSISRWHDAPDCAETLDLLPVPAQICTYAWLFYCCMRTTKRFDFRDYFLYYRNCSSPVSKLQRASRNSKDVGSALRAWQNVANWTECEKTKFASKKCLTVARGRSLLFSRQFSELQSYLHPLKAVYFLLEKKNRKQFQIARRQIKSGHVSCCTIWTMH